MYIVLIVIVLLAAFLVWMSADVAHSCYLRSLCRAQGKGRVLALTFDDGPDPVMTPRVLEVLRQHGVKATFFLVGEKAERHPELVRQILAQGHVIGSHTYSHGVRYTFAGVPQVKAELDKAREAICAASGHRCRLFRPPFGVLNPNIGKAVREGGYTSIGWSIRSLDTVASRPRMEVAAKVLRRLHGGAVILLHDRCEGADRLLETLLQGIISEKYRMLTIDEMFSIEAYED